MGKVSLVVALVAVVVTASVAVVAEEQGPTTSERIEAAGLKVRLALTQGDYGAWQKAHKELLAVCDVVERAWLDKFAEEARRNEPKMDVVREAQQALASLGATRAGLRWGSERAAVLYATGDARMTLRALRADPVYMDCLPKERAVEK